MKGPHIVPGCMPKDPSIMDIAPTVLYLMGEPVSKGMDGRVLQEVVRSEYWKSHPMILSMDSKDMASEVAGSLEELTLEDEERIKDRLKDLGYLG